MRAKIAHPPAYAGITQTKRLIFRGEYYLRRRFPGAREVPIILRAVALAPPLICRARSAYYFVNRHACDTAYLLYAKRLLQREQSSAPSAGAISQKPAVPRAIAHQRAPSPGGVFTVVDHKTYTWRSWRI